MTKPNSPHNFHIPVMGTGFTIDTPLKVAKYGISSVISLVDDTLIEQLRCYWSKHYNEQYQLIRSQAPDSRAKRITAYLNLLQKVVKQQITKIKESLFVAGSEITKYFEMLPNNKLKQKFQMMLAETNCSKKQQLQDELRQTVAAGSIDVNIMTKLDRPRFKDGVTLPYEYNDAAAALRGYANSELQSTLVFSAGFNPQLFSYLTKFDDFFPDENYNIKKKICLKVSDFRSAAVQGKYLAKHGVWVSEYRIESALNCGGHAFINDGQLLGPILEEFKKRKDELIATMYSLYKNAVQSIKKICIDTPPDIKITAQGGIGTNAEHEFLLNHYQLDSIGWGTPFLLVPEATNVDTAHLDKLMAATSNDVFLSSSSPLGVPFWNLINSASEIAREQRIKNHTPGNICIKGFAKINQEFTKEPICRASRDYQAAKIAELENSSLPSYKLNALKADVLSKSCICHDLAGSVTTKLGINTKVTPAICPGPNIINFKKIAGLKEMVGHIYGRFSLIESKQRAHMFIREIQLQLDHLLSEIKNASLDLPARSKQKLLEVKNNLLEGITYYKNLAQQIMPEQQQKFITMLQDLEQEIGGIALI